MIVKLIQYEKPASYQKLEQTENGPLQGSEIARRLTILSEACEGNSILLSVVEKLKKVILKDK